MRPRAAERAFPATARLRGQASFDAVHRDGRKFVDRAVIAFFAPAAPAGSAAPGDWRPAAGPEGWRLGLSVSRKVGGAPQRNRVKRVLREAFRHVRSQLPGRGDLLLIARPGTAPASLAQARETLARVLERWERAGARGPAPAAPRPRGS